MANVIIEVPAGSPENYEYDEKTGEMKLKFVFQNGVCFPFNYGSVLNTQADDAAPLDAFVISSKPLVLGAIVNVNPIGMLKLKDRGEQDNKLITVLSSDPLAQKLDSMDDLDGKDKQEILAFFKEVGIQKKKEMKNEGFVGKEEALAEIIRCKL